MVWSEKLHVCKKCLTLNPCFWLKYKSSIHNIAFSSEKSSRLNQEGNILRSSTIYIQKQSNYQWILMWDDNKGYIFSLEEVSIWIMECYTLMMDLLQTHSFSLLKALIDGLWIIVMFLSDVLSQSWWHPFTAEDPLVTKWCYAKISANFHF